VIFTGKDKKQYRLIWQTKKRNNTQKENKGWSDLLKREAVKQQVIAAFILQN